MDPLSDVLRSIRLTGGIFLDAQFTAPWCVSSHLTKEDCSAYLPAPVQIIAYHVVLEGQMLASIDDQPPIEAESGQIILIPRNERHVLASAVGLRPVDAHGLIKTSNTGGLLRISHGGGGRKSHVVCGYLASEQSYNPLIQSLPRLMKLDAKASSSRDWINASIRYAAGEQADGQFASSSVMARLSELLLVEAVRQYSATFENEQAGWLRGVRDPHVGRALALIHQDIHVDWSTDALAKAVALSRSAFVERFTTLVGIPPIRYLTVWRLQDAKVRLRETSQTLQQLAFSAGYASEEAFSRAFKREFGVSPSQWRNRQLDKTG